MSIGGGIKVEFHPRLFETAIERHGQYSRWHSCMPCFCIDELTRPDPSCKFCLGRGYTYYPTDERRYIEEGFSFGQDYIDVDHVIKYVREVYTQGNEPIEFISFSGSRIQLQEKLRKGVYYYTDYVEDLRVAFDGAGSWLGNGIVRALLDPVSTIRGNFVGELVEVSSLKNVTKNHDMKVLAFWEDLILTDSYADSDDEIEVVCVYVEPIKFLVNNITQKEKEGGPAIFQEADASCTFPGYLPVGKGDIITLLKAEQKASVVGVYMGSDYKLPYFHIKSILRIDDKRGDIEGIQIVRNNEIQFMGRVPEGRFSASFLYHPSFVVMGDLPSLRYGEDKVFPKKVALKRYGMMGNKERKPRATSGFEVEEVY